MLTLFIGILLAAIFWLIIFGLEAVNFWWGMTVAAAFLAAWSLKFSGEKRHRMFKFRRSHLLWGVVSAAGLYLVFWLGNEISTRIFPFASDEIESVYANRGQLETWKIGLLLFFLIGPAEEIFWRGYVQRELADRWGGGFGWIVGALIYAAVHLWAANFILFMAALIGGFFWGWIYKRFGSLWPGIISHSIWDVAIFLIIPI